MARIKFGAIVASINGSIGGTTFQKNRYGFTVKQKNNIVKPNKPNQLIRQQQVSEVSREWQALSQSQRDSWNSYAELYPVTSRLNPDAYLDGYAYFLRYREHVKLGGATGVSINPDGTRNAITNLAISGFAEDGSFEIVVSASGVNSDTTVLVYVSNIVPLGNTYKKSPIRLLTSSNFVSPQTILLGNQYEAVFGFLPFAGMTVDIQVKFINREAGQVSVFPKIRGRYLP